MTIPATPLTGPYLAIDVQYVGDTGFAAGILFSSPSSSTPLQTLLYTHDSCAPYVAGQFYKRELPPILGLLALCATPPATILVDGFVDLGDGRAGMGRHLYEHLGTTTPIVGVAKNPFRRGGRGDDAQDEILSIGLPVFRGISSRPLYVTSAGVDAEAAEALVLGLHGKNRQPTMLKLADAEARRAARMAEEAISCESVQALPEGITA